MPSRPVALAAAVGLLLASPVPAGAASMTLRCTNPASGTSWPIEIDLDRGRVDAFPATVTDKWIRWRDPKAGAYDLERATGKLQLRNASSTGGYFLHYVCRPE